MLMIGSPQSPAMMPCVSSGSLVTAISARPPFTAASTALVVISISVTSFLRSRLHFLSI